MFREISFNIDLNYIDTTYVHRYEYISEQGAL